MSEVYVLRKWDVKAIDARVRQLESISSQYHFIVIDTTSSSGQFRELSPFVLGPCATYLPGIYSETFENLWQYSKVYKCHLYKTGNLKDEWFDLDYDAYDHHALNISLKDVINNPDRKCGHAFILAMILTGVLEECLKEEEK